MKLFKLQEIIQTMGKANTFKFSYACAKNLRLVNNEIEDMQKALEPDEQMEQYEKERMIICGMFSKKKDGNPIITGNRFEIDQVKQNEFNIEMGGLRERYVEAFALNEKKIETYNKALKEEVDLNFHLVKLEDLPLEIKPDDLEVILDWVVFNDSERESIKN